MTASLSVGLTGNVSALRARAVPNMMIHEHVRYDHLRNEHVRDILFP